MTVQKLSYNDEAPSINISEESPRFNKLTTFEKERPVSRDYGFLDTKKDKRERKYSAASSANCSLRETIDNNSHNSNDGKKKQRKWSCFEVKKNVLDESRKRRWENKWEP